jgi:hypothetical protein
MAREVNSYGFPTGMNTVFSCHWQDCQPADNSALLPVRIFTAEFPPAISSKAVDEGPSSRPPSAAAVAASAALSAETDRVLFKLFLRIRAPRQNQLAT